MKVSVLGAGAFGTALAQSLAQGGRDVHLWARDPDVVRDISETHINQRRLPNQNLSPRVLATHDLGVATSADILLLCIPTQLLSRFLADHAAAFRGKTLVACCKGIDLETLTGPTALIEAAVKDGVSAVLTGPSFASDIAAGLPTALTLACANSEHGEMLQQYLSTPNLRLYRTEDTRGAELGGALKNVIAIACGIALGAKLGESARAAIMTRGFAEMMRLAQPLGARVETLLGLSGFGDLALTCTSMQSRNFQFGYSLGAGKPFDQGTTVEGVKTAKAVSNLAKKHGISMPVVDTISLVLEKKLSVSEAKELLLARPLKKE